MQHNQAIFQSIFGTNFTDDGNTALLQQFTQKHPYFSPAQFFLLQKLKHDAPAFEKQAVTANIFFNNAHWLNFQLQQTNNAEEIAEPEKFTSAENKIISTENDEAAITTNNIDEVVLTDKEPEPVNIELKMPEQKTNLAAEAMLFEPMHMVDYFASQGIKLSEEAVPADKLGKQLKSFTEWLKTMKKVHVSSETENAVRTDMTVVQLAESSNEQAEVLTEAMAEVFAQQGKTAKAAEVYQKLSLLNPAKSTYFAAKLENLKV